MFPLILDWLDLKLASGEAQRAQCEGRLKVFTELMSLMRQSYSGSDGADNVLQLLQGEIKSESSLLYLSVQRVENQDEQLRPVQTTCTNPISAEQYFLASYRAPGGSGIGWRDVFIRRRRFYFKLVLLLETSLSQGFAARGDDVAPLLQTFQFVDGLGEGIADSVVALK